MQPYSVRRSRLSSSCWAPHWALHFVLAPLGRPYQHADCASQRCLGCALLCLLNWYQCFTWKLAQFSRNRSAARKRSKIWVLGLLIVVHGTRQPGWNSARVGYWPWWKLNVRAQNCHWTLKCKKASAAPGRLLPLIMLKYECFIGNSAFLSLMGWSSAVRIQLRA